MLKNLLYIFLFISPICPTYVGIKYANFPIINLHRVIGFAILLIIVLNSMISRRWFNQSIVRIKSVRKPLLLFSMYFVWRMFTALMSDNVVYSIFIVLLEVLLQYIILIAVIISINTDAELKQGINILIFTAIIVIATGVFEQITNINMYTWAAPGGTDGVEYIVTAIESKVRDTYRVQASFMHPLVLAQYILFILPIAGVLFLNKSYSDKLIAIFVGCCGVSVLVATGSRSGIVVLAVQIVYVLASFVILRARRPPSRAHMLSILLITLLLALVVFVVIHLRDLVVGRGGAETMSTIARVAQIINGVEAVSRRPITGYGPGLAAEYVQVQNVETGRFTVDNYYLTILVESGVVGLSLFLSTLIVVFRILYSHAEHANNRLTAMPMSMLLCSMVGFATFMLILSSYELFGTVYAVFGMILVAHRNHFHDYHKNLANGTE